VSYVTEKRFLPSHNASLTGKRPAGGKYAGVAEKREAGSSLMFIGLAVLVAALLVVFFLPAAIRSGNHAIFVFIISVLAVTGVGFMLRGLRLRDREE
jgi:phosphatidylserine synthase